MKKLLLIDGSNLIFRAYYATERLNVETLDGRPANAIKTLITMLNKMIEEEKPTNIFIALDTKAPTFRHENYSEYKGTRSETPEKLKIQFPMARDLYDAMGIINYGIDGYEADDLIATYARKALKDGYDVKIVSGDKDLLQLVEDGITVTTPKLGFSKEVHYTPEVFIEKFDIKPIQFIEYKALVGDSSDNIIGVEKVGDKTARKLLLEYDNIENIIKAAGTGEIKGKVGENLNKSSDILKDNINLVTLIDNVPLLEGIEDLKFDTLYTNKFIDYLENIGFSALVTRYLEKANMEGQALEKKEIDLNVKILNNFDESLFTKETYIYTQSLTSNYFSSEMLGVALASEDNLYYISKENIGNEFKEWLKSDVKKVVYDEKMLMSILKVNEINNVIFDSFLAINLLDTTAQKKTIDFNLSKYGAKGILSFEEVYKVKSNPKLPDFDMLVKDMCLKVKGLKDSFANLANEIETNNLKKILYEIEMPLSTVLSHMEQVGVYINNEKLLLIKEKYVKELTRIEKEISKYTDINFNSPKQLSEYLFEENKLPTKGIKKLKNGYSTDVTNLEKLLDQLEADKEIFIFINLVLNHRKNSKILKTYLSAIESYISSDNRIHPLYNPLISETGRISTQDPSIQNIPIRSDEGKEIRSLFSAPKGKVIAAIDYSQVELRIMAHYSNDKNLVEAFKTDKDIHSETSINMFGDVSHRSKAKAINFGIIYGMSKYGLAKQVGITNDEAEEFINIYFQKYPAIEKYIENFTNYAIEHGYVKTLYDRKREVLNINNGTFAEKEHAKRVAINTPIQGTAADIMKLSMIMVYEYTKLHNIKILMQIHDELVFEIDEKEAEKHLNKIKDIMENVVSLNVPLKADGSIGENWLDAK